MTQRKVFILPPRQGIDSLFRHYKWQPVPDPAEADLLVLTGGSDVSPHLYGQNKCPRTYINPERDEKEEAFVRFWEGQKPFAGICRGAQLLNVLAGGTMWQDVNGHGQHHYAVDVTDKQRGYVTSTHHQMMLPHKSGQVLMIANQSTRFTDDTGTYTKAEHPALFPEAENDVEAVLYTARWWLCYQPHPEYVPGEWCANVFFKYIDTYLMTKFYDMN